MANVFNLFNATGNAAALTERPFDASFFVGVTLFAAGFVLNLHSDHVLRSLRAPGEMGYRIPFGGGFEYVSAPNYLGEIVEWVGFALAAQTLAAWAFAAFTFANLAPRALSNHRWYREQFPDYPGESTRAHPVHLVRALRQPRRRVGHLAHPALGVDGLQEPGEVVQRTGRSGRPETADRHAVPLDEDGLAGARPLQQLGEARRGLDLGKSGQHAWHRPPRVRGPQAALSQA